MAQDWFIYQDKNHLQLHSKDTDKEVIQLKVHLKEKSLEDLITVKMKIKEALKEEETEI